MGFERLLKTETAGTTCITPAGRFPAGPGGEAFPSVHAAPPTSPVILDSSEVFPHSWPVLPCV